jgi:hypothetical protein
MVMYFRLIEILTYYIDLMNKEFIEYLDQFAVVEINDILVYSKDEEEHEEHLCLECRSFKIIDYTPS